MFKFQASPDGLYNKTYFIPTNFWSSWIGGFSWCVANDLQMITFERQDEHDAFRTAMISKITALAPIFGINFSGVNTHYYIGSYSKMPAPHVTTGWIWYATGEADSLTYPWWNGQPDDNGNAEWCLDLWCQSSSCSMNDLSCNSYVNFRVASICQDVTYSSKTSGMKPKYI